MDFNWRQYIRNYKDLHHITSSAAAREHYLKIGKQEGRVYTPFVGSDDPYKVKEWNKANNILAPPPKVKLFTPVQLSQPFPEWKQYLENYEDLSHLSTEEEASQHYHSVGVYEGRIYTPITEHLMQQATTVFEKASNQQLLEASAGVLFFTSEDDIEQHLARCYELEENLPGMIIRIIPTKHQILTLLKKY